MLIYGLHPVLEAAAGAKRARRAPRVRAIERTGAWRPWSTRPRRRACPSVRCTREVLDRETRPRRAPGRGRRGRGARGRQGRSSLHRHARSRRRSSSCSTRSRIRRTSGRSCGRWTRWARRGWCGRRVGRRRSTGAAAKASAGAVHHVPVADVVNIARAVEALKAAGVWTVGLDAGAELAYHEWDLTLPTALVLGAEGHGLRRLVRERCDGLARIPMRGHVGSLNVSAAAAVVLYEAVRQRSRGR